MKVETDWKSNPTFEEENPEKWDWLLKLLSRVDYADTCWVGDSDRGNRIWVTLIDCGEMLGTIEYPISKLNSLTYHDIEKDLVILNQRPRGSGRALIQNIFDEFKTSGNWPNSREMSVEAILLGDYFELIEQIGQSYVLVPNSNNPNSITRLTIGGVSMCEDSENYLSAFLLVLETLLLTYAGNPKSPTISSGEFIRQEIIRPGEESMLYWMILQEPGLYEKASSESKAGEAEFTVSTRITRYRNVTNIMDYLRLQSYGNNYGYVVDSVGGIFYPFSERIIKPATAEVEGISQSTSEYDLFISYSTRDSKAARKINDTAEANGLTCFLAEKDLEGGDEWADRIRDALNNSREVVILVTPNSIKSLWVQRELTAAWVLYKRSTPILLNCTVKALPDLIALKQYRKFRDIEKFCKEVLKRKNAS